MEPSSDLPKVPRGKNSGGWQFRPGQLGFLDYLAAHADRDTFPGRYPTGYGKTEIIAAAYALMRDRQQCNRLLIVVPSETQEDQYADDLHRKAKRAGLKIRGVVSASRTERTLKYHRRNEAEIFVATIQRIEVATSGKGINWISELLETGMWAGAADEYHHYAKHNRWGAAIGELQRYGIKKWIALSATPTRLIGQTVFGAPPPECVLTYEQAFSESPPAVKDVAIKVREYGVTIEDIAGQILNCTASDLINEAKDLGIDKWEARKQVRYLSKYCSPILFHAVQELEQLTLESPPAARPQLLVYAHSCLHAKAICNILRGVAPGLNIEWAGTGPNGRDDSQDIIRRFSDEVDETGRVVTPHELDALVQVNMASEGFNSSPVCIVVDLSLTGLGPQKLQQYGRGTRTYFKLPLTIYLPTDSQMAKFGSLRRGIFDTDFENAEIKIPPPDGPDEPTGPGPWCPPLPMIEVIDAILMDCFDYQPSREQIIQTAPAIAQGKSLQEGRIVLLDPQNNDADYKLIEAALIGYHRRHQGEKSEEQLRLLWQGNVGRAVGQVARDYVNVTTFAGESFEKSRLGDACKRINTRWKIMHDGHEAMTSAEFKNKYAWLVKIQEEVRNGGIPTWLRS